jgi:hypothetical protein
MPASMREKVVALPQEMAIDAVTAAALVVGTLRDGTIAL